MTDHCSPIQLLGQRVTELECLVDSFDQLAGDTPPPWVWVLQRRIEALRDASEAVEASLGGYGGHDPHGDTQAGAPGGPSRPTRKPAKGSLRGSEKLSSLAHE
jgi:hypothetical protein